MKKHLLLLVVFLFLSSCGIRAEFSALDSSNQPVFIPPTLSPTQLQPVIIQSAPSANSSTISTPIVECTDSLTFIQDLSIPDGSLAAPDTSLDKRWSIRNDGTCNWGEGYTVRLISGEEMGAEPSQALVPARAGMDAEIRILFIAPQESGTYLSAWQAFNPAGLPFGDQFFITITVNTP